MSNGCNDLSNEDLVRLFVDPKTSTVVRNDALRQLEPIIRQTATSVCRRLLLTQQLFQDVVDDSFAHIVSLLPRFDPKLGCFTIWLRRVLHNFACDCRRRETRRRLREMSMPDQEQHDHRSEREESLAPQALEQHCAILREDLDHCYWPPSRTVDYYAVFLLRLRLALAQRYLAVLPVPLAEGVAASVARWIPWHSHEQSRRFRSDLPTLADLWQDITPNLDQRLSQADLLNAINRPGNTNVSYGSLAQWIFRARQEARTRLGSAWEEHGFGRLFESDSDERTP